MQVEPDDGRAHRRDNQHSGSYSRPLARAAIRSADDKEVRLSNVILKVRETQSYGGPEAELDLGFKPTAPRGSLPVNCGKWRR